MQENVGSVNLTRELSLLMVFSSRAAIAIRACNGIKGEKDSEDIRALSEILHSLFDLADWLWRGNEIRALWGCERIISKFTRELDHPAFKERRKLHFHVDPLPVLMDIEAKLRASTAPMVVAQEAELLETLPASLLPAYNEAKEKNPEKLAEIVGTFTIKAQDYYSLTK